MSGTSGIYVLWVFVNDTAPTEIYTLSLHDALPISVPGELRLPLYLRLRHRILAALASLPLQLVQGLPLHPPGGRSEEHTSELQSRQYLVCRLLLEKKKRKLE